MYVCVCNAITECELRRMARQHPGDPEAVYEALGKRPNCRHCLEEAHDILVEERRTSLALAAAA